jgi:hypothetical protein
MKNPSSRAAAVLRDLKINNLRGVDLRDVFSLKGIFYDDHRPLNGYLARIVSSATYSKITVSSTITYRNQKRFVQAHEFGHFELHRDKRVICDNERSFYEYHKNGGHEVEANEFAAELLMPRSEFKEKASSGEFSIEIIKEIAEYFETSVTSTAIRYAEFGPTQVAVVFSQAGRIRWVRINEKFPLQFIKVDQPVPTKSVVAGYYLGKSVPSKPVKVDAFNWFFEDFKIGKFDKAKVLEQVFVIDSINCAVSFIWLP